MGIRWVGSGGKVGGEWGKTTPLSTPPKVSPCAHGHREAASV